jgi:hypothetical protein
MIGHYAAGQSPVTFIEHSADVQEDDGTPPGWLMFGSWYLATSTDCPLLGTVTYADTVFTVM